MRNRLKKPAMLIALVMGAFLIMGVVAESVTAMPMFARKYGTSCNTCHIAIPRLNAFGRAYKKNSFFWPGAGHEGDDAAAKIKRVELGNAHFGKRATISESVPIGFVAAFNTAFFPDANTDLNGSDRQSKIDFGAPTLDIFTGGTIGDSISYLVIMAPAGGTAAITPEAAELKFHGLVGNILNFRAGLLPGGPATTDAGYEQMFIGRDIQYRGRHTGFDNSRNAGFELYGQGKMFAYGIGLSNGNSDSADPDGNNGIGSATKPGKTAWIWVELQLGGMALDGTGGAKHAQSWRDDHFRIHPYFMYASDDNGYKKTAFGAELELWYNIIEFKLDAQSVQYKAVVGSYDENAFIAGASLDFILMNGTIVPGAQFTTDLNSDAKGRKSTITGETGSTSKKPMWLNLHVAAQLRANVKMVVQGKFKLHSDAALEASTSYFVPSVCVVSQLCATS
jgi:hypothetical protein